MTKEQFIYWLQGFFEIADTKYGLDALQARVIKDHLALVFEKVTPDRAAEQSQAIQGDKKSDNKIDFDSLLPHYLKPPSANDLPDPWSWVGDRTKWNDQLARDPSDPFMTWANPHGLGVVTC